MELIAIGFFSWVVLEIALELARNRNKQKKDD
jgi:hypothetical protein